MENLEMSNPDIVDEIRNVTIKLRDVKSAVKDLLEVMEKSNVGSKEVDDFVREFNAVYYWQTAYCSKKRRRYK